MIRLQYLRYPIIPHFFYNIPGFVTWLVAPSAEMIAQSPVDGHCRPPFEKEKIPWLVHEPHVKNTYQILLMMLADLQHPSTVQSQSWDPGLGKCKSQGSHQSYARWEQEQAAEPHLQRLLTQVITKFRQHILTKVWEGITIV